jgi:transposase
MERKDYSTNMYKSRIVHERKKNKHNHGRTIGAMYQPRYLHKASYHLAEAKKKFEFANIESGKTLRCSLIKGSADNLTLLVL